MNDREHKLQVACVNWFGYAHPTIKDLLIAIPNGGHRNKVVAKKLKAEGVKAGVPDLFLALPSGVHSGLWIEMKAERGVIRPNQREYLHRFAALGYAVAVCFSFDDFEGAIENYINKKQFE